MLQMGLIALEKAFLLVSQTQWREAYECLEKYGQIAIEKQAVLTTFLPTVL